MRDPTALRPYEVPLSLGSPGVQFPEGPRRYLRFLVPQTIALEVQGLLVVIRLYL